MGGLAYRAPFIVIIAENLGLKRNTHLLAAVTWFIICTWLLTLPGSKFPKDNWLDKIGADKIVHILLFAALTWIWCLVFRNHHKKTFFIICLLSIAYGVVMEFIQRDYIPNRGFDVWDMIADAAGSLLGLYLFLRYKKK